jgi:proline racemase
MIYAMVNGASLGLKVSKDEARDLVELGERIKAAAAEQIPAVHPENPEIHTINQTLFAGPFVDKGAEIHSHNAVIVSPGRIDRSPCGTGTSARMAIMHARGQMKAGQTLVHESLIGTKFYGRILEELTINGAPAIRPEIAGQAWITAFHHYVLDPTDPFPNGFRLGDLWLGS